MVQDRAAMLVGIGVGASLMYFLDPAGGGRRRARARDQLVHAGHVIADAADATSRDVTNRAAGLAARLRSEHRQDAVDDRVLVERVRAQLGRHVSHPRAIDLEVRDGIVTLKGPILRSEVSRLCEAVCRVNGVREVVDNLETHETAANVPALQGGRDLPSMWNRRWSPTVQLAAALAATAGLGLMATAMSGVRH